LRTNGRRGSEEIYWNLLLSVIETFPQADHFWMRWVYWTSIWRWNVSDSHEASSKSPASNRCADAFWWTEIRSFIVHPPFCWTAPNRLQVFNIFILAFLDRILIRHLLQSKFLFYSVFSPSSSRFHPRELLLSLNVLLNAATCPVNFNFLKAITEA
jgi:hypothetical protein